MSWWRERERDEEDLEEKKGLKIKEIMHCIRVGEKKKNKKLKGKRPNKNTKIEPRLSIMK